MTSTVKKHGKLSEISGALNGRLPTKDIEILDHKYTLRLLKPEAEDWVATRTEGVTLASTLFNSRKPTVAAALDSIDDIPIEELFAPSDIMEARAREDLKSNITALRDWRRSQVLEWLREEVDTFITDGLYEAYSKLAADHKNAMTSANLSKRTPSDV